MRGKGGFFKTEPLAFSAIEGFVQKQPPEVHYYKKVILKFSKNSQENTCARVYFLIRLQVWGLQLYLKRDSGRGVLEKHLQATASVSNKFFKHRAE